MKQTFNQGITDFGKFWDRSRQGISGGIRDGVKGFRSELRDATTVTKYTRSTMTQWDQPLLWAIVLLVLLGVVMVYSASITLADGKKYANYSSSHFLVRHILSIGIAVFAAILAYRIPSKVWEKIAPLIFGISVVLLILVLIPGIGKSVNFARRWIPLGIMNFQPSELMKLAVVIFVAHYTVRRQEHLHSFVKGFLPMGAMVGLVGVLLLLEPDMGAFMVIAAAAMGVLFLGGINAKLFGA